MGYGLARLIDFAARVKNSGRCTLYGPKYGLRKKSIWVGMNSPLDLRLVDQSLPDFIA